MAEAAQVDVQAFIEDKAARVNTYLAAVFPADRMPKRLFEAMNYSLLAGGKRLRPVLCLATAETLGAESDPLLPVAAAIEMIHCYSLIHDDLPSLDNDDLRRGRPTNHKVFGEAMALLAGDGLLTYAFEQLSSSQVTAVVSAERQVAMIHTLAHAAGCYGMVGGQVADIEAERSEGSEAELRFIHIHKTAKLIQAAVLLGAQAAAADTRQLKALEQYGLHLGLAYQMVDDLLDVVATTEQLGKTAGKDAAEGKLTYPRLFGLDATWEQIEVELREARSALADAGLDAPLLVGLAETMIRRAH
jgi:geranylgeranyl diphosphate synthase type II